jgi:hypothetical protein
MARGSPRGLLPSLRRPEWPDFPKRYASAAVDAAKYSPVEAVQGHRVRDRPVLWFTPDKSDAVVDRDVLSEVTIADVTRLKEGDPAVTVTRIADGARGEHPPRTWLRWLIAFGALQTFIHVEATLCLESERETKDGYEATVSGRHLYYTNERNEGRYPVGSR